MTSIPDSQHSSETQSPRPTSAGGVFVTTHWSVILSARDQDAAKSAEALEELCRAYWYPLYAFARRSGQNATDAEDLTQGFFARVLEKDYLKSAAREKGRFRTFLLTAFKRFMANEWDHRHAQKRGGFTPTVPLEPEDAESRFSAEPGHNLAPDVLFDRQWASTLLTRAMNALRQEYVASGRTRLFEELQNCLTPDATSLPYAQIATRLNLSEAAVKMAVHRLRARYRETLQAEIAKTVASSADIEDELRHLFSAF